MDSPDLAGHQSCVGCGGPVLDIVAHATGSRCSDCWQVHLEERAKPIELYHKGFRVHARIESVSKTERARRTRRNKRKEQLRKADPVRRKRLHKRDHAKRRAMRRLRALYPAVYDQLHAEERAKLGLEPWPVQNAAATPGAVEAQATLPPLQVYAPESHGPQAAHPEVPPSR